jgi:hypothetical protein
MRQAVFGALVLLAVTASAVAAQPGAAASPIPVKMKRGTDSVSITGVLRPGGACCTYAFEARAGQRLYWSLRGPATRQTIGYPDGHVDGPGLPNPLKLPMTGAYSFAVRPNLMADGAYGRFELRMRIPPLKAK